eukprot:scaffold7275_cov233-Chaetoceros_neogracile.AAC.2
MNWEQNAYRDPSPPNRSPNKSSSPQLYPNVKPLSAQKRYKHKEKDNMTWGFDPWASPSNVTDTDQLFQEDGRRSGVPRTYDPNTSDVNANTKTNTNGASPSSQRKPSQQNFSRNSVKQRQSYLQMQQHRSNRSLSTQHKAIIPGVSQMTMRQILSVVFSAFWDRADLYTDVLDLENDRVSPRQLKLAFLRQGRVVLATPIESPDDMTLLSAGIRGMINGTDGMSTISVVQSGTPVSRKAKLKFQAISLAYELLKDGDKRKTYDEWLLWNSRLPPPQNHPPLLSMDQVTEELPAQQEGLWNSSSLMNQKRHVFKNNPGTSEDSSVISILRNPNAHKRFQRNRRKKQPKCTRNITWNEEVEEVTISEQLPSYDPMVDSDGKENLSPSKANYHAIPDPYGDSAEEWFGTVDCNLPEYDRSMKSRRNRRDKQNNSDKDSAPSILFAQEADMGFGKRMKSRSNKNNKIQDEDSALGVVFEGQNPDDSLVMILDGPDAEPQIEEMAETKPDQSVHEHWNGFSSDSWQQNIQDFANQYTAPDLSVNNTSKALPTDTPQAKNISRSETAAPILHPNPEPGDDDGDSMTSNGNSMDTGSWASLPSIDYQDDCDIGRTVDLARGFQASLSNYINAAVEDMKEGLQVIGKQWDDLEMAPTSGDGNFFFLHSSELDAMMGILKTEMDDFTTFTKSSPTGVHSQAPEPVLAPKLASSPTKAPTSRWSIASSRKQKSPQKQKSPLSSTRKQKSPLSSTSKYKASRRLFGRIFSRS